MVHADVITLIKETNQPRGRFEAPITVRRDVFANIRSVGFNEFYRAKEAGIEPTFVFTLSDYDEYENEKIIEYNGEQYRVVRTYVTNASIEITVERATNDVINEVTNDTN